MQVLSVAQEDELLALKSKREIDSWVEKIYRIKELICKSNNYANYRIIWTW